MKTRGPGVTRRRITRRSEVLLWLSIGVAFVGLTVVQVHLVKSGVPGVWWRWQEHGHRDYVDTPFGGMFFLGTIAALAFLRVWFLASEMWRARSARQPGPNKSRQPTAAPPRQSTP
jgi:hypothetical protein